MRLREEKMYAAIDVKAELHDRLPHLFQKALQRHGRRERTARWVKG